MMKGCPASCPGPKVPHHCLKQEAGQSFVDAIKELRLLMLKPRRNRPVVARALATSHRPANTGFKLSVAEHVPEEIKAAIDTDVASAKRLFKYVAGVLNGAFSVANVADCARDILRWLPDETSRRSPDDSDVPYDVDVEGATFRISFTIACRALAAAIGAGVVPMRGILVLKQLRTGFPSHGIATNSPLCDLLCGSDGLFVPSKVDAVIAPNTGEPSTAEQSEEDEVFSSSEQAEELENETDVELDIGKTGRQDACTQTTQVDIAQAHVSDSVAETQVDSQAHVSDTVAVAALISNQLMDKQVAAHRVFKFVAGYLSGVCALSALANCTDAIQVLFETCELKGLLRDGIEPGCVGANEARYTFEMALDALSMAIEDGKVPQKGVDVLLGLWDDSLHDSPRFLAALKKFLCPACAARPPAHPRCRQCLGSGQAACAKCLGSGRFKVDCRFCSGIGRCHGRRLCTGCNGSGKRDQGSCNRCQGQKHSVCDGCDCRPSEGQPRPFCDQCLQKVADGRAQSQALATQRREANRSLQQHGPPEKGVRVERCNPSDLSWLQSLWLEREADGHVTEAWKVENPLLAYKFRSRCNELNRELGRSPHDLHGFHGTHPDNILSICQNGFDRGKRGSAVGQVYGAGEYFAKNPNVSMGYCRDCEYMLVCRLSLGFESSDESNSDGDHIWVPAMKYYVISSPAQVLPQYIVRFSGTQMRRYGSPTSNAVLEKILRANMWTTIKAKTDIVPVPPPRPCLMSRPFATVLWMGLLHSHVSDKQLEQDIRTFLGKHAPAYVAGMKVQICSAHFKKAHAILEVPIPKDVVHKLNTLFFEEAGQKRRICIEDAHGSPEQKCPKAIAGYCRGQNLRFTHPCWCRHEPRKTETASFELKKVCLHSAKGNEILTKFMSTAPFHNGRPTVVEIKEIKNKTLSCCHEEYRRYLSTKQKEEPVVRELYHGTNNNILDVLYTHGLQPPSDMSPSELCRVSGGKGLCTSLCTNSCKYCVDKHEWKKCHMFGLGIYLGDMAQKSHRYCSQPEIIGNRMRFRMIVCSVLGKAFKIEGHLKTAEAMHDIPTVRALNDEKLAEVIEPCRSHLGCQDEYESAEKSDMLFVQGLGSAVRQGYSVVNSEYIAFHPHQCLPKYEITYDLDEGLY